MHTRTVALLSLGLSHSPSGQRTQRRVIAPGTTLRRTNRSTSHSSPQHSQSNNAAQDANQQANSRRTKPPSPTRSAAQGKARPDTRHLDPRPSWWQTTRQLRRGPPPETTAKSKPPRVDDLGPKPPHSGVKLGRRFAEAWREKAAYALTARCQANIPKATIMGKPRALADRSLRAEQGAHASRRGHTALLHR